MAIGWKGETRGRRVDKGVKGLLSHSRHSKRTWCGLQFFSPCIVEHLQVILDRHKADGGNLMRRSCLLLYLCVCGRAV